MKSKRLLAIALILGLLSMSLTPVTLAAPPDASKPVPAVVIPPAERSIEFDTRIDATGFGPWMFDQDLSPYVHNLNPDMGVYAYQSLVWNPDGVGNGSPGSGGSGQASFGTCTAVNSNVQATPVGVTVEFNNFQLTLIQKVNWAIWGQSGDHRDYTGGTGTIKVGGVVKLKLINCRITNDVSWPAPLGPGGATGSVAGSGWGTIDRANSDDAWEAEFDNGNGQVEFVFTSFSSVVQSAYGAYASHLIVRSAAHQEDIEVLHVIDVGPLAFPATGVSLDVLSFTRGGLNHDLDFVQVTRVAADPGGAPPAGFARIVPDQYWQIGNTLDALSADVTFDVSEITGVPHLAALTLLRRDKTGSPWQVCPGQIFTDATHIRVINPSLGEFGLGEALAGDVNRDGQVSVVDLTLAAAAFNSTPGLANWNPAADWNSDSIINVFDLVVVGMNFGRIS